MEIRPTYLIMVTTANNNKYYKIIEKNVLLCYTFYCKVGKEWYE